MHSIQIQSIVSMGFIHFRQPKQVLLGYGPLELTRTDPHIGPIELFHDILVFPHFTQHTFAAATQPFLYFVHFCTLLVHLQLVESI